MNHSQFTTLLPATAAERKQALTIRYGLGSSPFGAFFLASTEQGICRASFVFNNDLTPELNYLSKYWPKAQFVQDNQWADDQLQSWFRLPAQQPQPIRLHLAGSAFQLSVWQQLLDIPFGSTSTYQRIAQLVGKPRAFRAVGSAVGANPITFLVPCHRVLQTGGGLGGYFWGLKIKQQLLAWEGVL